MRSTTILGITLAAAFALWLAVSLATAQAPKGATAPTADVTAKSPFAGKVVVISFRSDPETSATLEKFEVKQFGNQAFIVGQTVDDGMPDNWSKGRTTWVPVDDVAHLVEFPDVETLKKALGDDVL
ncbi:MAG TPA: hypothetical protein VFB96_21080 [Pirellulaceae bacterium]|nr:hypothetical protein [Pirellulaceae bacterium]